MKIDRERKRDGERVVVKFDEDRDRETARDREKRELERGVSRSEVERDSHELLNDLQNKIANLK